eukprot:g21954.t1
MLEDISPEALHAGQLGAVPAAGGPLVVVQDTLVRLQHLCIEAAKRRAEGESDIWARLAPTLVTRVLQEHPLTCAVVLVADKPALTTPLKQATQQKRAQSRAKLAQERKLPPPEQIQVAGEDDRLLHNEEAIAGAHAENLLAERQTRPLLLQHVQDLLLRSEELQDAGAWKHIAAYPLVVLDLGCAGGCWALEPEREGGRLVWRQGRYRAVQEGEADLGCFRWAERTRAALPGCRVLFDTVDTDFLALGLIALSKYDPACERPSLLVSFRRKFLLDLNKVYDFLQRCPGGVSAWFRADMVNGTDFLPHASCAAGLAARALLAVQEERERGPALGYADLRIFVLDVCAAYVYKSRGSVPFESNRTKEEIHLDTRLLVKRLPKLKTLRKAMEIHNLQVRYWQSLHLPEASPAS